MCVIWNSTCTRVPVFTPARMEDWKELCQDSETHDRVFTKLEEIGICAHLKHSVQSKIEDESTIIRDLHSTVDIAVNSPELQTKLKNAIYEELIRLQARVDVPVSEPRLQHKEPLDFIRVVQEKWEAKLRRGINTLCTEKNVLLCKERSPYEQDQMRRRWNSIGSDFPGLMELNPIFSGKDFLEVLIHTRNPNYNPSVDFGGLMNLNLNIKSFHELRTLFSCIHPSQVQMENSLSRNGGIEYYEKAEKVLKNGLCPLARQLCKGGCPVGLRRELWSKALALDTTNQEHTFSFEELKTSVLKYNILFEKLLVKDVKKIAANDDNYFVFEDTMHQVLLCFLHDKSIVSHLDHLSVTPMEAHMTGHSGDPDYQTTYPPNGIIPFHGFSQFIAPLCFIFDRADRLYALFKRMYLRYFVHLHCVSSHPHGILGLCCQFEHLFQCKLPELFEHLRKIGAEPLRLSFSWIMMAFAGYLDSRQVLYLWDRIVGHDSLSILPVMAVAVYEFRATNLFKATTLAEVESVLSDLRCLNVLPLLQQTLFL